MQTGILFDRLNEIKRGKLLVIVYKSDADLDGREANELFSRRLIYDSQRAGDNPSEEFKRRLNAKTDTMHSRERFLLVVRRAAPPVI